ncbi:MULTISPECIES: hypothetical protein [unclassified Mesorhizobium]|uniref:hypothetical protein n=1 Tax=unclassified Mesorhizobium TaxID=325217 RepID=UPI0030152D73
MLKPKIDFDKPVPTPDSVSEELRNLLARQETLIAEQAKCDEGQREIARENAQARRNDDRETQIDALIKGSAYEPPADTRDRMAALARRRGLLVEATHELAGLIRVERTKASTLIVAEFKAEQEALAREFYEHLAKAVSVHSRFGDIKQRLEHAGVSSEGLHDFGAEIMGLPNRRNDHASYALRDGVKRGYIDKTAVPLGYL